MCVFTEPRISFSSGSIVFAADDPKLLPVRVVGERLDDVRACVDEIAVELGDDLRVLEHDFGDEGARLQIPTPLELEYVALGADDRALVETLQEGKTRRSGCGHDK